MHLISYTFLESEKCQYMPTAQCMLFDTLVLACIRDGVGMLSLSKKDTFPSCGPNSRKFKSIFFRIKTYFCLLFQM